MEKADKRRLKGDKKYFAEEFGGKIFSFPNEKMTVAVWPVCNASRPDYFMVATSFCSATDEWKKKIGQREVMQKMFDGGGMLYRAGGYANAAAVANVIREMMFV